MKAPREVECEARISHSHWRKVWGGALFQKKGNYVLKWSILVYYGNRNALQSPA